MLWTKSLSANLNYLHTLKQIFANSINTKRFVLIKYWNFIHTYDLHTLSLDPIGKMVIYSRKYYL